MKVTRFALLILACGALMAASCADPPPRPGRSVNSDLLGPIIDDLGLLGCTPLAADSASQAVGPDGGTISVGPHQLDIPAGALDSSVVITAVMPSTNVNVIWFQPEGLTFGQPATLTMSYANCGVLGFLLPKHIAYTSGELDILALLPAVRRGQTLRSHIQHFSGYAVAW